MKSLAQSAAENTGGRGVFLASRYLTDIAGCLEGGACPTQVFEQATPEQWSKSLSDAQNKITATHPDWGFKSSTVTTEKGFILVASGVMSTGKIDVDRDILEPKGAEWETKMPYLWHHIIMQPVGKVLGVKLGKARIQDQSVDAVLFKTGIMDVGNGLGRDTAALIEMDAIRNSHGFEPLEAKPRKGGGWHIQKYRTYEISGVTLPANTDAVFVEYSKEKSRFRSDVVKAWIKGHYDTRKRSWKGWGPSTCTCQKEAQMATVVPITLDVKVNKPNEPEGQKFYISGLPGSWEYLQQKLHEQLEGHLAGHGKSSRDGWACIEGTFPDYVIASVYDRRERKFYKIAWSMEKDGPAFTDAPVEVDVEMSVSVRPNESDAKDAPPSEAKAQPSADGLLAALGIG